MVASRKRSISITTAKRRCGSCQQRHIKCEYESDDEKCKACRTANRSCVVRHRFQHVDPTAPKRAKTKEANEEPEKESQASFKFIAETGKDNKADEETKDQSHTTAPQSNGKSSRPQELASPPTSHPRTLRHNSNNDVQTIASFSSPTTNNYSDPSLYSFPDPFSPGSYVAPPLNFQSPASAPTPEASRLGDREKALLLRHFTDVLSRWFDVCDPEQHFRRIVPLRALTCPTLMKAISASAAWHLCRLGKFDRERSNFLYENCLKHLINAMDSPTVGSDDSVLVAAVIMHHVEELRDLEHTLNLESRGHLIGIHVFLDNQDTYLNFSSLRTAAFRTAIREENHVSFVDQQPLTLNSEVCNIDRSFDDTDDDTWAWRMILIFRDALAYSLSPSTTTEWDSLWSTQESWRNIRPNTFDPMYFQETNSEEGRFLPEVWFLHDCHTIGQIHYHLSRLMLAISNPRTPKIGWTKTAALKRIDEEVRKNVLEICGIAKSNHLFPSAMTAASMVIVMCAENITDPNLQEAVFDILPRTREVHAWPTEAAQRYVKSVWQAQQEQSPSSPRSARSRGSFLSPNI